MIKLTSMNEETIGMPIYLAADKITAVFETTGEEGGSLKTVVLTIPDQLWLVEEGLSEVIKLIKEVK